MDEQSIPPEYLPYIRINTRTLATLAAMGVYQDGVAKNAVNGKPVTAHVFEYTTQISIDPSLQFR
jgi:chitin synthase